MAKVTRKKQGEKRATYWREATQGDSTQRKYYSISEVAKRFGVEEYTLRHWEKQVEALRPLRSSSGARLYREEDFPIIEQLRYLTIEKGLQIPVAKELLGKEQINTDLEIRNKLLEVKAKLQSIQQKIDAFLEAPTQTNDTEEQKE